MPALNPWRGIAVALVLVYWLANALLHLAFSNWIVSTVSTPWGAFVPLHYATAATAVSAAALLLNIVWRARRAPVKSGTLLLWLVWMLALAAADRWLLTTRVESIHYLQYGIIGALLAWALDPDRRRWPLLEILLLSLLLSIADELYQYLHLAARQGTYFDFNDLLLNQLGALAGLLFYYGFNRRPQSVPAGLPRLRRVLVSLVAGLCLGSVVLLQLGLFSLQPGGSVPPGGIDRSATQWRLYWQREPNLYGNWIPTFSKGFYLVLSPLQGVALLLLSGATCAPGLWPRGGRDS